MNALAVNLSLVVTLRLFVEVRAAAIWPDPFSLSLLLVDAKPLFGSGWSINPSGGHLVVGRQSSGVHLYQDKAYSVEDPIEEVGDESFSGQISDGYLSGQQDAVFVGQD